MAGPSEPQGRGGAPLLNLANAYVPIVWIGGGVAVAIYLWTWATGIATDLAGLRAADQRLELQLANVRELMRDQRSELTARLDREVAQTRTDLAEIKTTLAAIARELRDKADRDDRRPPPP